MLLHLEKKSPEKQKPFSIKKNIPLREYRFTDSVFTHVNKVKLSKISKIEISGFFFVLKRNESQVKSPSAKCCVADSNCTWYKLLYLKQQLIQPGRASNCLRKINIHLSRTWNVESATRGCQKMIDCPSIEICSNMRPPNVFIALSLSLSLSLFTSASFDANHQNIGQSSCEYILRWNY